VLGAAWAWWSARLTDERLDAQLLEFATATIETGALERCEVDPERFFVHVRGGPPLPGRPPPRGPRGGRPEPPFPEGRLPPPEGRPPPPEGRPLFPDDPLGPPPPPPPGDPGTSLWAYDAEGRSRNPGAPPLPSDLAARLAEGAASAASAHESAGKPGRQLVLRTGRTSGPCVSVLVRRLHAPEARDPLLLWGGVAVVSGVLLAVLLAAGPVVRRLRRLERRVRASAGSGYREPVPVEGRDEVARLADAFNVAGREVQDHLARVEARERTLREFVSNTTHDVTIPLTVLQAHLVALREAAEEGRAGDPDRLRQATEEAHYVGSLLRNLETLARLEAEDVHLDLRAVDLADLVRRAVERHGPIARGRSVALEHAVPEAPLLVRGDVTLLEQAVSNLVQNAVLYAPRGGHAAVVLETPRPGATTFRLLVRDDGPGIAPEERARALERGWRGHDARTRRPGGAGLGLAIVKDVADRHGFTVALGSVEPHGLEVTLTGPLHGTTATNQGAT
jgi:signal transduction histidine kinase